MKTATLGLIGSSHQVSEGVQNREDPHAWLEPCDCLCTNSHPYAGMLGVQSTFHVKSTPGYRSHGHELSWSSSYARLFL